MVLSLASVRAKLKREDGTEPPSSNTIWVTTLPMVLNRSVENICSLRVSWITTQQSVVSWSLWSMPCLSIGRSFSSPWLAWTLQRMRESWWVLRCSRVCSWTPVWCQFCSKQTSLKIMEIPFGMHPLVKEVEIVILGQHGTQILDHSLWSVR